MTTDSDILTVSDVNVDFSVPRGTVHALTGVSLSLRAGETVGIVGESGCGKSTLAKVLVGLQAPTSGHVSYDGQEAWRLSASQRRKFIGRHVGMIFQDPSTSLNRRMPVAQILRDPLDVHRLGTRASRDRRVDELLDLVGLPKSVADALPSQLSGGQRQRISIGRALALNPRIIIADEPTSALDVSVRAQILNLLMDLKTELNLSMVYISHDIQTVRRISDRIATMYLGRLVEDTPALDVDDNTRHPYTRALLSATPSLLHAKTPISLEGPVPSAVNPPSGCPFRTRCWKATAECAETMPEPTHDSAHPDHVFRCFHPVETQRVPSVN
ncbi:peptide ABC transporter ATP-binding protein [Frondihabitans sp. PAMC 28766]|uniref:ABC transporter ATP-binding protein n=1 Tax=Frondihabitans sp. PAMC 28766 TaxID=1795630 RepID=UPI00078D071A|nr:ABC transporter ATP-binding protein [Frondihabitans sp. PAMC 28766]AMM20188.1 peptide ABC transporter ATP-binding protein [Frondihabitans sp. PAMC 28766]